MAPLPEERAEGGGGRAEGDEYGGEAGDEEERGDENVPPRPGLALVDQRLDARPGQIAKIGRRQRQHAGADERDEPGAEGGRNGDVGHGRTDGPSVPGRQILQWRLGRAWPRHRDADGGVGPSVPGVKWSPDRDPGGGLAPRKPRGDVTQGSSLFSVVNAERIPCSAEFIPCSDCIGNFLVNH